MTKVHDWQAIVRDVAHVFEWMYDDKISRVKGGAALAAHGAFAAIAYDTLVSFAEGEPVERLESIAVKRAIFERVRRSDSVIETDLLAASGWAVTGVVCLLSDEPGHEAIARQAFMHALEAFSRVSVRRGEFASIFDANVYALAMVLQPPRPMHVTDPRRYR